MKEEHFSNCDATTRLLRMDKKLKLTASEKNDTCSEEKLFRERLRVQKVTWRSVDTGTAPSGEHLSAALSSGPHCVEAIAPISEDESVASLTASISLSFSFLQGSRSGIGFIIASRDTFVAVTELPSIIPTTQSLLYNFKEKSNKPDDLFAGTLS